MIHELNGKHLSIKVDEHGAELKSLVRRQDNSEMLWQGNPKYWAGQSPILFPTVGRVFNDSIMCEGKKYHMPKHGLVKDMDFRLLEHSEDSLTFAVRSNAETMGRYPYPFRLIVRYILKGRTLEVEFEVENRGEKTMPFHLGAHPALCLPQFNEQDEVHGYLGFDLRERLVSNGVKPGGYLWPEGSFPVMLDHHDTLPLTNHTFDCDTILDSRGIARACTLYNIYREPLVRVNFNSPILALWAPNGGQSPFVCIEPWWGCCDEVGYEGEFVSRPWTNTVEPRQTKKIDYSITVL